MSAIAAFYERSNTPVDPGVLERVMARLSHRGPDGQSSLVSGPVALGHLHFWSTPEEVGEKQPLAPADLPFCLAMDGRLDNRADLLAELSIPVEVGRSLSDAALALKGYERWGKECFQHFIGEFAVVIWDTRRGELLCARDALGDRTLYYSQEGTRLVVASEPWAVAAGRESPVRISDRSTACYFALQIPSDGQSLFEGIYELLPGQVLAYTENGMREWFFWQPDFSKRIKGASDQELAEQFRQLLAESVRCRLRSNGEVGVLMSGGLDSTSVACLAAEAIAPRKLTTISYVFDELADCDERDYINSVQERWGTNSIQIPSDDLWPFKSGADWPVNPNKPEGNLYRLVKDRAYHRAHQAGMKVLLTGAFGDYLYSGAEDWLADLLADGRFSEAIQETWGCFRKAGAVRTLKAGFLQRVARRGLNRLPGGKKIHRRGRSIPPWMTPSAAGMLSQAILDSSPELRANLTSSRTAQNCTAEIFHASRHGFELRHPYRDRRLVEFVISLPAYQFYRHGIFKRILRFAMHGRLPEIIRTRKQPTSLVSFYRRGFERERAQLRDFYTHSDGFWQQYVQKEWLGKHWQAPDSPEQDGPGALVLWLCFSYTKWTQSFRF